MAARTWSPTTPKTVVSVGAWLLRSSGAACHSLQILSRRHGLAIHPGRHSFWERSRLRRGAAEVTTRPPLLMTHNCMTASSGRTSKIFVFIAKFCSLFFNRTPNKRSISKLISWLRFYPKCHGTPSCFEVVLPN
jgi:hypothetical protein